MLKRWLILLLVLAAPFAARAEDALQPADPAAIRQVIQGQMEAFRSDDWNAAFAFAAPAIQGKFVSPDIFRQMVTGAYQPVYRPKGVEFRALEASEFGPTQEVFVIGPDGLAYLAYYTMERQADGTWRISGCYLVRAQDESV
jgi:ketosteroid isomerase-like protein